MKNWCFYLTGVRRTLKTQTQILVVMLQQFDQRNSNIHVWVGHGLVPREEAKISVFDSSVQGGDAVWEGMRVYQQGVYCLDRHLDRLEDSSCNGLRENPPRDFIRKAIKATLEKWDDKGYPHPIDVERGENHLWNGPKVKPKCCTLIVLAE